MRNPLLTGLKGIQKNFGGSGLGRVKVIRFFYDLAVRILKPRRVRVLGHSMWLDDRDTLELSTREIYEPAVTRLFQKEIRPGQTVLDIGANIGYFTLLAARLTGASGKVYAFEPDPVNFGLLSKNISVNGYTNIVPISKAVSNKTQTAKLYLSQTNRGDHRLYDSKDGRDSVAVETISLDVFLKPLDSVVHFIKMDIQGAEAKALEGMKGLLRANRKLKMVTEFEPAKLAACGSGPLKYLDSLKKAGFKLWEIQDQGPLKPAEPKGLLKACESGPGYVNLYCVKDQ